MLGLRVSDRIRPAAPNERGKHFLTSIGLFVFSGLVLLSGLFGVFAQRGIENGAMKLWAFGAVALIGLVFVMLQVRAFSAVGSLLLKPDAEGGPEHPSEAIPSGDPS